MGRTRSLTRSPLLVASRLTTMYRSNKLAARACSPMRRRPPACTAVAGQRMTAREGAVVVASSSRVPSRRTPPTPRRTHHCLVLRPTHTLPVPHGTVLYTAAAAHPDTLPLTPYTEASMLCFLGKYLWSVSLTCTNCTRRSRSLSPLSMRPALVLAFSCSDVLTCDRRWRGCLPCARRSL